MVPLRTKLLGSVRTIAIGLVIGATAPGLANAALTCAGAGGSIVGSGSCVETITFSGQTDLTNAALTIDKWISTASPGFTETLLDVKFNVGGSISSSGTLTNNSASTQSFKISISEDFTFSPGSGAPSNFLVPAVDVTGTTPQQTFTLAAGASTPFSAALTLGPVSLAVITTLLNQYTGPGTFNANLSTLTGITILGGGGNIAATQATNAIGEVDVEYDFVNSANSTTPLPAALPLFASGLGALGLLGWRRKRKNATAIKS
jgi:hypothetical protein